MQQEMCALTLKTALSGQTIERLLSGACIRPYFVTFNGIETTPRGERKVMRISFALEDDRERFRQHLRRLASVVPAPAQ
jgi:hypothetical protein